MTQLPDTPSYIRRKKNKPLRLYIRTILTVNAWLILSSASLVFLVSFVMTASRLLKAVESYPIAKAFSYFMTNAAFYFGGLFLSLAMMSVGSFFFLCLFAEEHLYDLRKHYHVP